MSHRRVPGCPAWSSASASVWASAWESGAVSVSGWVSASASVWVAESLWASALGDGLLSWIRRQRAARFHRGGERGDDRRAGHDGDRGQRVLERQRAGLDPRLVAVGQRPVDAHPAGVGELAGHEELLARAHRRPRRARVRAGVDRELSGRLRRLTGRAASDDPAREATDDEPADEHGGGDLGATDRSDGLADCGSERAHSVPRGGRRDAASNAGDDTARAVTPSSPRNSYDAQLAHRRVIERGAGDGRLLRPARCSRS